MMQFQFSFSSKYNFFFVFFSFLLQVGWKRRHTIDQEHLLSNPLHFPLISPSIHTSSCPAPLKTKNALKLFSSQLPQRLKTAKAPLQLSTLTCPSFLISYDTLCMCSLTAVYINQYIYQTAAAYCVCRFDWTKDTRGASMLCQKGPFSSLPSLLLHRSSCFSVSLFLPPFPSSPTLCLSSSHTQI